MSSKLLEILTNNPETSAEEIVKLLSFSDTERKLVERTTIKQWQWQCEEWYLHKAGFITASKCKRVFTRQETLDKNPAENAKKLVQEIGLSLIIPKPQQKKLSSCCLLVIQKESWLREQPSSNGNGNVKSGTFTRQGLSQPQSAKEFSPARKHLTKTLLKMQKSWYKKLV